MKPLAFATSLFCAAALLLTGSAQTPAPTPTPDAWLFAYFRQRYDSRVEIDAAGHTHNVPLPDPMRVEQLHLALSSDGRHWTPLNGNRPVWEHRLRDPFLQRGPDGLWRVVATGRAQPRSADDPNLGPVCLSAVSRDLLTWEDVRSLPLMTGIHDETGRPARNIWAPEWFYDADARDYVVHWSSSFEHEGWQRGRLWYARTKDWQTFTPAQPLFTPPYSAIDGTLLEQDHTFYLFHKEEEFAAATGERRAVRLATSDHLSGPYQIYHGPLNDGQIAPTITEGPCVMPDPVHPGGWLLLYDYCMTNAFGLSTSKDLLHWTVEPDASFPPDARHGSVVRLTADEAARLRAAYPE